MYFFINFFAQKGGREQLNAAIMKKIIGIGNALVDILIRMKDESLLEEFSIPKASMQLVDRELSARILKAASGMDMTMASGGSAANTIHGLARLGVETGFIGCTGHDSYGEFFRKDMGIHGIHTILLEGKQETGRAVVLVTPDSERTFATFLGSAVELKARDIRAEYFKGYDLLYLEGYLVQNYDLVEKVVKVARETGLKICIDLASYNVVEGNREFLQGIINSGADMVFANEEEATALTGGTTAETAEWLAARCELAVIKMGPRGSVIRSGKETVRIGITEAQVIDTTGAGDLYASGFLYGLVHRLPLSRCGSIGAMLASKIIEQVGTKMEEENWEEVRGEIRLIS